MISHWQKSQVSRFFGCCTADSKADEDQNQLNNNLKQSTNLRLLRVTSHDSHMRTRDIDANMTMDEFQTSNVGSENVKVTKKYK